MAADQFQSQLTSTAQTNVQFEDQHLVQGLASRQIPFLQAMKREGKQV